MKSRYPLVQWSDRRRLRLERGKRSGDGDLSHTVARDCPRPAAPSQPCCWAINTLWKAGISCGKGHVTLLLLRRTWQHVPKYRIAACTGDHELDNWRSTILRWGAVAFSFGAWVGVVVLVRQLLDERHRATSAAFRLEGGLCRNSPIGAFARGRQVRG